MANWSDSLNGLSPELQEKAKDLFSLMQDMGCVVVAFSGGVDSALVATVGHLALGENLLAVTAHSPVETPGDAEAAVTVAKGIDFQHKVITFDDFANPMFVANPPDRCYHCKLMRLKGIQKIAAEFGESRGLFCQVVEGSNADDASDYRPGAKAVAELGVRSPLAEACLTKAEIRALAQAFAVPVWNRPSAPCLATRFPYGNTISREGITQVAQGEAFLKGRGFKTVRVRHFGSTARIEVLPENLEELVRHRDDVLNVFKSLGFTYVVIDLAGYRSGAMNEVLNNQ